MMKGTYRGNKRVEILHEESGSILITDAPKDNQGEGQSFSPTDLCAVSLASCILTTIAIKMEGEGGVDLSHSYFTAEKMMSSDPRRIASIRTTIHLPSALNEKQRVIAERVGRACPVHRSLAEHVEQVVEFSFDVE
jgi:putative redox protein